MRIGVKMGAMPGPDGTLDQFVERVKELEARGFHSTWLANIFAFDAIAAGFADDRAADEDLLALAKKYANELAGKERSIFGGLTRTLWGDVADVLVPEG